RLHRQAVRPRRAVGTAGGRAPHGRAAATSGWPRPRVARCPAKRETVTGVVSDLFLLQERSRRPELLAAVRALHRSALRSPVQSRHLSRTLRAGHADANRRASTRPLQVLTEGLAKGRKTRRMRAAFGSP